MLATPQPPPLDEVAHLSLMVGRLLLANGADTAEVQTLVERFACAHGCEAQLMVSYESLLLTVASGDRFRTKTGRRVPAMNVGLSVVRAVTRIVDDAVAGHDTLAGARAALEAAEHHRPEYSRWIVVVALGLTAGSLARLFGGDWPAFAAASVAGAVGTWLRQEMGRRAANLVATALAAAAVSGLIGAAAVLGGLSATPSLCLVAPGMIIVPGVPFINGFQDLIRNHVTLGVSRLAFAMLVTTAIALGLYAATALTGISIPVEAATRTIPLPEDAAFSALAAIGFATLFNVPPRIAWACIVCAVGSHTTRTLCTQSGLDLSSGTLIGALIAGALAQGFARLFRAPSVTFAFPGVVAMVPGAYAFRFVIGALQIAHGTAPSGVIHATLTLGVQVVLMMAAIATGIVAPTAFSSAPASR